MPAPPRRKFNVLDAMALVAATAVGLALWRFEENRNSGLFPGAILGPAPPIQSVWEVYDEVFHRIWNTQPLLFSWTVALLLLRLRRPRPALRRLARQPGFAAVAGVVLVTLINFLGRISSCFHFPVEGPFGWDSIAWWYHEPFRHSVEVRGAAVAAIWAVMTLGRSSRPEASWIDRGGRLLGILWLILYALWVAESQPH